MAKLQIGIVGDFNLRKASHWATEAALYHAAAQLTLEVVPTWVGTSSLTAASTATELARFDGIFGSPGSPYVSEDGMLRAIEFHDARLPVQGVRKIPPRRRSAFSRKLFQSLVRQAHF